MDEFGAEDYALRRSDLANGGFFFLRARRVSLFITITLDAQGPLKA